MKSILLLLFAFIISGHSYAQRIVQMRTLWVRPQVHVSFGGYTISFTIKDINKALALLAQTGDTTFGKTSGLDTATDHNIDLYPGTGMQYLHKLEPLIQQGVGAFLLSAGHAYIKDAKHRTVHAVIMNIQTYSPGTDYAYILFYDPRSNKMLFSGQMANSMYNQDLGIN